MEEFLIIRKPKVKTRDQKFRDAQVELDRIRKAEPEGEFYIAMNGEIIDEKTGEVDERATAALRDGPESSQS